MKHGIFVEIGVLGKDRKVISRGIFLLCIEAAHHIDSLESFCEENHADIAVFACPKELVKGYADRCVKLGFKGIWNYMGVELDYKEKDIVVENMHLGDSLMILNCRICRNIADKGVDIADPIED